MFTMLTYFNVFSAYTDSGSIGSSVMLESNITLTLINTILFYWACINTTFWRIWFLFYNKWNECQVSSLSLYTIYLNNSLLSLYIRHYSCIKFIIHSLWILPILKGSVYIIHSLVTHIIHKKTITLNHYFIIYETV